MKKTSNLIFSALFLFILVACGNSSEIEAGSVNLTFDQSELDSSNTGQKFVFAVKEGLINGSFYANERTHTKFESIDISELSEYVSKFDPSFHANPIQIFVREGEMTSTAVIRLQAELQSLGYSNVYLVTS